MTELKIAFINLGIDKWPNKINDNKNIIDTDLKKSNKTEINFGLIESGKKDVYQFNNYYTCNNNIDKFKTYLKELYEYINNTFKNYDLLAVTELCNHSYKLFENFDNKFIVEYSHPPSNINEINYEFMKDKEEYKFGFDFSNDNSKKYHGILYKSDNIKDLEPIKGNLKIEDIDEKKDGNDIFFINKYVNKTLCINKEGFKQNNNTKECTKYELKTSLNSKSPFYGSFQFAKFKFNDKYIYIINSHNRLYDIEELIEAVNQLCNIYISNNDNIIIGGDFNFNKYYRYKRSVIETTINNIFNKCNIKKLNIVDIYNKDSECNEKLKKINMGIYYKLKDFEINLDDEIIKNCTNHIKTSSHIIIPLVLKDKPAHSVTSNIDKNNCISKTEKKQISIKPVPSKPKLASNIFNLLEDEISYKEKYLKYKTKYLKLKNKLYINN